MAAYVMYACTHAFRHHHAQGRYDQDGKTDLLRLVEFFTPGRCDEHKDHYCAQLSDRCVISSGLAYLMFPPTPFLPLVPLSLFRRPSLAWSNKDAFAALLHPRSKCDAFGWCGIFHNHQASTLVGSRDYPLLLREHLFGNKAVLCAATAQLDQMAFVGGFGIIFVLGMNTHQRPLTLYSLSQALRRCFR